MKPQLTLAASFILSLAIALPATADEITISCLIAGYSGNGTETKLIEKEYTQNTDLLQRKPSLPGGGCVPQTIRSDKFNDSKNYASLRISMHRCGEKEPYFYAAVTFGGQKYNLTSFMAGLSEGVAVNVSGLDEEEPISTPHGDFSSIRIYCKSK